MISPGKLTFLALFISGMSCAQAPANLFVLKDLREIILEPVSVPPIEVLTMSVVEVDGKRELRIECQPVASAPSVYLKSFTVKPGEVYTFILDATPSDSAVAYFQVVSTSSGKAVVWPGARLASGITLETFQVPADVSDISVGFAIVNPKRPEAVNIRDAGFFPGRVSQEQWKPLPDEGLQVHLIPRTSVWTWIFFPIAGIGSVIIIAIYLSRSAVKGSRVNAGRDH